MKIGGVALNGPKQVTLVLPRDDGDLVFKFVAVVDDDEFDKIYPEPVPPVTFNVKAQEKLPQLEDPGYKAKMAERAKARAAWIFLKSVEPSGIEWTTVKKEDPTTWSNWEADLRKAGMNIQEMNAIWSHFAKANFVTQEMLDEARKRFLASQAAEQLPKP
jgi:hypothetical protein